MFRIIQQLNNNAALVKDEKGNQAVVMGKGVAFQKKKGDIISKEQAETIFSIHNDEAKESLLLLLKDIPLDFISVTYEVIDRAIRNYQYPIQDYLYVTLTDHIYCAYQSILNGTYQDSFLPDISKDYPTEYKIATDSLRLFRSKLLQEFPDEEVGRLALHFINARGEMIVKEAAEVKLTKELMSKIEEELVANGIVRTSVNSHFYDRFMIHLNYFLNALNREQKDGGSILVLEQQLKKEYPQAFSLADRLYQLICSFTGKEFGDGERLYIVLHIQRLL